MEITFYYLLSQVLTILMYALLAWTYFLRDKRKIVIVSALSLVANIAAYVLLGAWTGLAMCVVAMLRNLYILCEEKRHGKRETNEKRDYIFLALVYLGIILATIPTYEGFLSLFSVFATSIYTYSIWQKSTKVYKFCGIPVGILWIAYNTYVRSILGVILEGILLVASIAGYAAEVKSTKGVKIKSNDEKRFNC